VTAVSLSRWTMAYFGVALCCLAAAETLMALGFGFPRAALQAPETLILVHIVTIGWLSLLMCGALFQFVPVLVAQPLYSNALPLPALAALVGGLAALILGFLQLDGRVISILPLFALASALLGLGVGLVVWNLARTALAAASRPLPARFVMVGLVSLAATAALGVVFGLVLGGTTAYPPLVALTALGLPLHVIAGLGGWLTVSAMGVSYRLLAMFMLAPESEGRRTASALAIGAAALAIAIGGGALAILLGDDPAMALVTAGGLGLAALVLYGADLVHLYQARKRRNIELNSRMTVWALASLAASAALTVVLLALGRLADQLGAVVFLIAFGWLSGLGLAQLYKIIPFLTWLECYGPILGKAPTPRVQDLVVEARAIKWFALYFVTVWIGAAALIAGSAAVFQAAAAAMLLATGGISAQFVRARRLADVKIALQLPQGARRPPLLFSQSRPA
jgi:hypothetical protein